MSLRRLLAGAPDVAARGVLGCALSANGVTLRITEVEAYAGTRDAASHAFRGRTGRNAVMFGPAGFAYVYFTYGMHWCMNVVCGPDGEASAVLLRAGEVVRGLATARARRPAAKRDADLARGPARLCSVLGITGEHYGVDLLAPGSPVQLRRMRTKLEQPEIVAGPRVGVTGAHDVPWRFWYADDPTVSTYRRHVPKTTI